MWLYLEECAEEAVEPEGVDDFDRLCAGLRGALWGAEAEAEAMALRAIHDAIAGWEEVTVEIVREGGVVVRETERRTLKRDWRAAMKYLETRYRDQWGAKLVVDVTRQIQKTVILTAVPDELKPGAGEAWAEERARREAGYADAGSAAG